MRVEKVEYLTVAQVTERLNAAGYPDKVDTVRRDIDRGRYGQQGGTWYRTPSGYRMVKASVVRAEVERRRSGQ